MSVSKFILGHPISIEENRQYEFKEVKGNNPIDAIKNTVDEYAVAFLNSEGGSIYWGIRDSDRTTVGVHLNYRQRDKLRRSVTEKLTQIQPPISPTAYRIVFHNIYENKESDRTISDLFVVEVVVPRASTNDLYFTGGNTVFVKTDAGKKKLTGLEIQDEIRRRHRKTHESSHIIKGTDSQEELANSSKRKQTQIEINETGFDNLAYFLDNLMKIDPMKAEQIYHQMDLMVMVEKAQQIGLKSLTNSIKRLHRIDPEKTRQILEMLNSTALLEKLK